MLFRRRLIRYFLAQNISDLLHSSAARHGSRISAREGSLGCLSSTQGPKNQSVWLGERWIRLQHFQQIKHS